MENLWLLANLQHEISFKFCEVFLFIFVNLLQIDFNNECASCQIGAIDRECLVRVLFCRFLLAKTDFNSGTFSSKIIEIVQVKIAQVKIAISSYPLYFIRCQNQIFYPLTLKWWLHLFSSQRDVFVAPIRDCVWGSIISQTDAEGPSTTRCREPVRRPVSSMGQIRRLHKNLELFVRISAFVY